jgi:hypothetical protein
MSHCSHTALLSTALTAAEPDWVLEGSAPWQARDSQAEWVFRDRLWIGGGWFGSYEAPPRDVWSSADGVNWVCETEHAPWAPRLWFSAAVYRGRIWVLGGWSKEHDNHGDVWHSADGRTWQRLETKTCWKARHEHSVFVFRDKLWIAGGHARPLSSEVWSLSLPADWKP